MRFAVFTYCMSSCSQSVLVRNMIIIIIIIMVVPLIPDYFPPPATTCLRHQQMYVPRSSCLKISSPYRYHARRLLPSFLSFCCCCCCGSENILHEHPPQPWKIAYDNNAKGRLIFCWLGLLYFLLSLRCSIPCTHSHRPALDDDPSFRQHANSPSM